MTREFSRILRNKNAKFSGYCFYLKANIYWDFEICISVPLKWIMSNINNYKLIVPIILLIIYIHSFFNNFFLFIFFIFWAGGRTILDRLFRLFFLSFFLSFFCFFLSFFFLSSFLFFFLFFFLSFFLSSFLSSFLSFFLFPLHLFTV